MRFIVKNINDLKKIIFYINNKKKYNIINFYGCFGSGKTTLIKYFLYYIHKININTVTSPAYTIVNEYKKMFTYIYHFDFYSIKDISDIYYIGFIEYISSSSNLCLIEWPQKIENILNKYSFKYHTIKIYQKKKYRLITFK